MEKNYNIACLLTKQANKTPDKIAVLSAKNNKQISYKELDTLSNQLACSLNKKMPQGTKCILMVEHSIDFFIILFALFKAKIVPVVVDPGMGIKRMLSSFKKCAPSAFIGIFKAYLLKFIFPSFFKGVKVWIRAKGFVFKKDETIDYLKNQKTDKSWNIANIKEDDLAAILFTTGSTGPAKGVCYTHKMFNAQIDAIKNNFKIKEGEVDLSTFPLFALFAPALGMISVIPDMDPKKPIAANPLKIINTIYKYKVDNLFASPALLGKIGSFAILNNHFLNSLKRVISAGAPVSSSILHNFSKITDAKTHTPYGATEAMPMTLIDHEEILKEARDAILVGYPIFNLEIIKITDNAISKWDNKLILPVGEVGEIVVKGATVSKEYFNDNYENKLSKIQDEDGFWHRMGDVGFKDETGRLHFCGRKKHMVRAKNKKMFSIVCESVFNKHKDVKRSALVGVDKQEYEIPIIFIELKKGAKDKDKDKDKIKDELLILAQNNEKTKDIKTILFHKSFPVDIRHNAKIFREKLKDEAIKRLKDI